MRILARALPLLGLLAALVALVQPRRAETLPLYAARQGLMCRSCHFDPNGGGPRNDFGFAFAKNRHSMDADTSGLWKDLDLTNRVSDRMPVYFGVDQRFMMLANTTTTTDSLDRLGFYNMENALYVAFQPHARLTLVYSRDGFNNLSRTQDAFGMIGGLPLDGYVKAGRFRTPFGLRMDDHTVATRNAFLDFQSGQTFLPYDPRVPDMGVEVGAERSNFFGRAAFTNGASDVFGPNPFAEAFTAKVGHSDAHGQGALSIYDNYVKGDFVPYRRATRWGAYAISHWRQLAFIGDLDAGTDEAVDGSKRNLLAGFAEVDYAFNRAVNFRLRYDRFEGDRNDERFPLPDGSSVSRRDYATWQRYALEGEIVPVPFAELRWVLRLVDPKASRDVAGNELKTEKQAYLQFHFSY